MEKQVFFFFHVQIISGLLNEFCTRKKILSCPNYEAMQILLSLIFILIYIKFLKEPVDFVCLKGCRTPFYTEKNPYHEIAASVLPNKCTHFQTRWAGSPAQI